MSNLHSFNCSKCKCEFVLPEPSECPECFFNVKTGISISGRSRNEGWLENIKDISVMFIIIGIPVFFIGLRFGLIVQLTVLVSFIYGQLSDVIFDKLKKIIYRK